MAIESIGASVMSYQGTTSEVSTKPVQESRDASVQGTQVAQEIATDKVGLKVQQDGGTEGKTNDGFASAQEQNEKIRKTVEEINRKAAHNNVEAQFGIHEATNRVTIKIVDKDTHEIIREVPPEKTLDMIAKAWELAGLMVDERR